MLHTAEDRHIIIDLRRVTSMDSSAIALLYRLSTSLNHDTGTGLELSGMTAPIQQMIKVVGLQSAFQCIDDEQFYDQLFEQSTF